MNLATIRLAHYYVGVFFAPWIIFFAFTGSSPVAINIDCARWRSIRGAGIFPHSGGVSFTASIRWRISRRASADCC